jgi:hypothetical protein
MTNLLDKTSSTYIFINPESRPLIIKILATLIMIFGLIRLGIWTVLIMKICFTFEMWFSK